MSNYQRPPTRKQRQRAAQLEPIDPIQAAA